MYQVKSADEPHQRIVRESEISDVRSSAVKCSLPLHPLNVDLLHEKIGPPFSGPKLLEVLTGTAHDEGALKIKAINPLAVAGCH